MPNFESAMAIANLAVLASSLTGAIALFSRKSERRLRMTQLVAANNALRSHINALKRLDSERSPPALLAFALVASEILTDEDRVKKISEIYDAEERSKSEQVPEPIRDAADHWVKNDFDSVDAFIEAFMFAVVYAENRWPDCAGRLGHPFKFIMAEASERHEGLANLFGMIGKEENMSFKPMRPQPI